MTIIDFQGFPLQYGLEIKPFSDYPESYINQFFLKKRENYKSNSITVVVLEKEFLPIRVR